MNHSEVPVSNTSFPATAMLLMTHVTLVTSMCSTMLLIQSIKTTVTKVGTGTGIIAVLTLLFHTIFATHFLTISTWRQDFFVKRLLTKATPFQIGALGTAFAVLAIHQCSRL